MSVADEISLCIKFNKHINTKDDKYKSLHNYDNN